LRIEREKRERAERHKQKRAALTPKGDKDTDAKKAAIQAAMERAKAKREANPVQPKNVTNLTEEQLQQIAEADARRNQPANNTAKDTDS
jgi:electron transport complex protein RnfC